MLLNFSSGKTHYLMIPLLLSVLLLLPTIASSQQLQSPLNKLCSAKSNDSIFGQFEDNLNTFLHASVSYYDIGASGFYNATEGEYPDTVYGLLLCSGGASPAECRECGNTATQQILRACPYSKAAIIWYDDCLLRYSNESFFSTIEASPFMCSTSVQKETEPPISNWALDDVFQSLVFQAASSPSLYGMVRVKLSKVLELYGRAECTRDLSKGDCSDCLQQVLGNIPGCRRQGKEGGVLTPSCNVRYELFRVGGEAVSPAPAKSNVRRTTDVRRRKWIISAVMIGIPIISAVLLLAIISCLIYCVWRKKRTEKDHQRNCHENQLFYLGGGRLGDDHLKENMQELNQMETEFPLIRLDLLHAATQRFSDENKLGEGGFGPVYKGTLMDGMEIAVKRLSRRSSQGLEEFKNEVSLIAKLQHRNLVRLIGCCIEASELLLVYEYLSNKSLDFFLFNSGGGIELDWRQRFSIMNGIARGLLYLHEDSHHTVIHRDLKASNVLLDRGMNPKISDFGVARILGGNQNEASTDIVVGTFGYMAPEYATQGLFSVKSDVFSFGVLVLEIISGKKNGRFNHSEDGPSLLTLAWKLWTGGRGLELIDPLLEQSCVETEVLKCLHIGLLCVQKDPTDRPNMSFVVVMLGSNALTALPRPIEPEFYVDMVDCQDTAPYSPKHKKGEKAVDEEIYL